MPRNRKIWTGALLMLALCFVTSLAFGQEAAGGETAAAKDKSLWDLLKAGGFVGWCIIVTSIATLALTIEFCVSLRRDKLCPPELVGELEALIDEGQFEEALQVCENDRCFLTNVVGAALAKVGMGYDEMVKSMEEVGSEEAFKLNAKISYMSLLGNLGPMLGLLGTVTGMIGAFTIIERTTSPTPALLARGVYEALVTTAEGLFVGIPALTVFFIFKNRVTSLVLQVGGVCSELVQRMKEVQK
ncbi:MAG: MotA/TolQ/ExbB proton channel family protein [Planctomycetes bacterium]|nr:MotA/TolQ/ExbB proton channel family protein [Planctomycetota bacterium]